MSSDAHVPSYSSDGSAYSDAFRVFLAHTDQKANALAWLDREVAELPARNVLIDAGAGSGALAARLAPQFSQTIAIEPNPSLMEQLRAACPAAQLISKGILSPDLKLTERADFVVCSHVFYYVERTLWLEHLQQMASWLQPRGVLAATIQNPDTDCMRLLRDFTGARYDLAQLGEQFLVSERGEYRAVIETVPAHVDAPDIETATTIAEFMLNLTPLRNPPLRSTVQDYLVRHFLQPRGNVRFSCHQDFLRVSRV